jgi:MFS family permease
MKRRKNKLFYGWIVVAIAFFSMALVYGVRYTYPVFFVALEEEFGWTRTKIYGSFSLKMIAYAFSAPLAGALFDRWGPRRLFPVSALVIALGLVGCSQMTELWHLYLFGGLVIPLGMSSLGTAPHSALLSNWFVRNRGLVIGMATSGMGIGLLGLSPLAQWIISNFGFRWAYALMGIGVFLVIALPTALFQRHRPEDKNLLPDGETPDSEGVNVGAQPKLDMVVDRAWTETEWTLGKALCTRRFWLFFATLFFSMVGVYGVVMHEVSYAVDMGFSKITAATAFGLTGFLGAAARILWGAVGDRVGREPTYSFIMFLASVAIVLFLLMKDFSQVWLLYVAACLYGLGYGSIISLVAPVCADIFQSRFLGSIYGFALIAGGSGGALGPFLSAYIFDTMGSYTPAFLIHLASLNLSSALMWVVAPRKVRLVVGKARAHAKKAAYV